MERETINCDMDVTEINLKRWVLLHVPIAGLLSCGIVVTTIWFGDVKKDLARVLFMGVPFVFVSTLLGALLHGLLLNIALSMGGGLRVKAKLEVPSAALQPTPTLSDPLQSTPPTPAPWFANLDPRQKLPRVDEEARRRDRGRVIEKPVQDGYYEG